MICPKCGEESYSPEEADKLGLEIKSAHFSDKREWHLHTK